MLEFDGKLMTVEEAKLYYMNLDWYHLEYEVNHLFIRLGEDFYIVKGKIEELIISDIADHPKQKLYVFELFKNNIKIKVLSRKYDKSDICYVEKRYYEHMLPIINEYNSNTNRIKRFFNKLFK